MAAGAVTFCLDTKSNQKNQDRKKLQRCRPDSLARLSVRPFAFVGVFTNKRGHCIFDAPGAVSAMSILVSLGTAAAQLPRRLVLFCLDTKKYQKKSRQKKASALQARLPGPLFCQAFARFSLALYS